MTETVVTDGRSTRSARTRRAVVDALLGLIEAGNPRPTAREIASEAGVSLRTLYVHFDDVEALFIAAAARHFETLEGLREPVVTTGSFDERLTATLDRRVRIYEAGAAVRHAALLQEPFSPTLQDVLETARYAHRADIEAVFAAELQRVPPPERARLRRALEVVLSPSTWDALRHNQELSPDAAKAQVRDMVEAVVDRWSG